MSAVRTAWIAALGSLVVIAALALSASGLISAAFPVDHRSQGSASWHGQGWNNTTGPYAVTFTESGLPTGTFWGVTLHLAWGSWSDPSHPGWGGWRGWHDFGTNGSTNSTVGFLVGNGTYDYRVFAAHSSGVEYVATPNYGNFTVNGTNVSVAISFAPIQFYNVSFDETGLPSGTFWGVVIHGVSVGYGPCGIGYGHFGFNGSTSDAVNFSLPSGTYQFRVLPAWNSSGPYVATPENGSITVNGGAVTVDVTFAPVTVYTLTFTETGLPNGTFWAVGLYGGGWGGNGWNATNGTSLNFTVTNGTYLYWVGPVPVQGGFYAPTPGSGNVTVSGAAVTVDITFTFESGHSWGSGARN